MFLEIDQPRIKIRKLWKDVVSTLVTYTTRISRALWSKATCALQVQNNTWLKVGKLWVFSYELLPIRKDIRIIECAPFWWGIHLAGKDVILDSRCWRSVLLWKWIAGAIEFILLSREQEEYWDFCVVHSSVMTDMREAQLRNYKLIRRLKLCYYLDRLKMTVHENPNFKLITKSI